MARPRVYDERVESTVRLPKPLHDRLKRYVGDRPMNPVIETALTEYLDRQKVAAEQGATGPFDWSTTSSTGRA